MKSLLPVSVYLNNPRYEFRILLREKNVLYVEIPKNASSSIKSLLLQDLPAGVSRTKYNEWISAKPDRNFLQDTQPELFLETFSFAVTRNPYERTLSAFLNKKRLAKGGPMTFADFLESLLIMEPNRTTISDHK